MGKTLLVSSHILADLDEICTDVAIIEEGRLVWTGSLATAREALRRERFDVGIVVPQADAARAVEILSRLEEVRSAELQGERISVKMEGRHGNQVLQALIHEGIEIRSFAEERVHLEAIFLEQTRGVLS